MKILIIVLFLLLFVQTGYAYNFKEYINSVSVSKEDKEGIRQEWKEAIGIDIWQPYFNIDNFLAKKTRLTVWKFNGRLIIDEKKDLLYIFKYTF